MKVMIVKEVMKGDVSPVAMFHAGTGAILNRQISAQYSCEKKRIKITTKQQNTTSAFRRLSAIDEELCIGAL